MTEEVDVGAHRGERRAQLVAGVDHQPLLLFTRRVEGDEHGVEARREPADLVVALHRDRRGEVLGLGDALGGVGELLDGTGGAPHHQPRRERSERDAGEGDDDQARAQHVEDVVGLRHLAGDLHRTAVAQRRGDHAVLLTVDGHVAVVRTADCGSAAIAWSVASIGSAV